MNVTRSYILASPQEADGGNGPPRPVATRCPFCLTKYLTSTRRTPSFAVTHAPERRSGGGLPRAADRRVARAPAKEPDDHGLGPAVLEDHVREQINSLVAGGLSEDEAFLVAVKRMGAFDALTREFARGHSERLWKQLVLSGDGWDTAVENRASVLT